MKISRLILVQSILFVFVASISLANGDMSLANPWAKSAPAFLVERSVKLVAENGLAMLEVEDIFNNPLPFQAEGLYRFTMPSGAFAGGLWINTDGEEWVPGEIRLIEEARRIYHGITARMVDPGLMEQNDSELVIRVFPVEAESKVAVRFRCFFPESFAEERFVIPIGFNAMAQKQRAAAMGNQMVKFSLDATFSDSAGLKNFSTNFDKATITSKDKVTKVTFQTEQQAIDDLKVFYDSPAKKVTVDVYEGLGQRKYSLIRIMQPEMPQNESELKLGVIVDTSGSMGKLNRERALMILASLANAQNVDLSLFRLDETGLFSTSSSEISHADFYGSAALSALASFQNDDFDAVMLISDAHDLRSAHLSRLWRQINRMPVWLVTVGEKFSATLSLAGAELGGYTVLGRTNDADEVGHAVASVIKSLRVMPVLMSPSSRAIKPLFGLPEQRAFYVLPFEVGEYKLNSRNGVELLNFSLDETREPVVSQDWFLNFAVRQRIVQLAALEQTPEVARRITDLGLRYSQTTDYTAFVAVPDEIARQHSDVFNPVHLAMFAVPNFRRARGQARSHACWANQRVLNGAIEMLLMDEADPDIALDPETGEFDQSILVDKRYLRVPLTSPEPDCEYRLIGGMKSQYMILCLVHGAVNYRDTPIREAIEQFCEEHGFDSSNFDVPEDLFGITSEDPLAPVMRAVSIFMYLIMLMI